jgi:hypothetical protein
MPRKRSSYHSIPIGVTDSVMLPASETRVAVVISPEKTVNTSGFYAFGEPAVLHKGFLAEANIPPLWITKELIGPDIQLPMHGIAVAAGTVAIVEISEVPD